MNCPQCGGVRLTPLKDGKFVNRYWCNDCCVNISDTSGTVAHKTHLPEEKREKIVKAYNENMSIRQAADYADVNKNTIGKWFGKLKNQNE